VASDPEAESKSLNRFLSFLPDATSSAMSIATAT
jgi:hypothetical protein